jgi:pimeloyl-ACP methyl ester carboxylesterase
MKKQLLLLYLRIYLNFLAWVAPHKAGRIGFYIFCRPQRRAVKPHHEEFFNTSEKFTTEYENKKVQAYKWGTGEKKLLLLHGWESHTYWWRNVINNLSKEEYTIISIDAPGHGLSEGNYMNIVHYSGLIEQIILQHRKFYALLAHSLGAFSTAYTFYRLPQLPVEKLVLMAAPGESVDYVNYYQKLVGFSERAMKEIRKYFVEKVHHEPEYFSFKEFAKRRKSRFQV